MSIIVYVILAIGIALAIVGAVGLIIAQHGERLGIVRTGPILDPQPEDYQMGTLFTKVPVGSSIFLRPPDARLPSAAWPPDAPAPTDVRISIERANSAGVKLGIDAPPDMRIILPKRGKGGNSIFIPHCAATPAMRRTQTTGA